MFDLRSFYTRHKKIIVVLAIIAICLYFIPMGGKEGFDGETDTETNYSSSSSYIDPYEATKPNRELYLFYSPRCTYCKALMDGQNSVWDQVVAKHNGRSDLSIRTVNGSENGALAQQFGVKGFPTILMKVGDRTVEYQGNRSPQDIDKFIENVY